MQFIDISCNKYLDTYYDIEIIDQNGIIQKTEKSNSLNTILNIYDLKSGMYYIKIRFGNTIFTEKIIKQ